MEKLEAIEDNNKRVEAVENLAKPSMAEILVMYRKAVGVQRAKENLRLDCIVALNTSWLLKNGTVAGG